MKRGIFAIGLSLSFLMFGCTNTVEDVCKDLSEECAELREQDCLNDGKGLETSAQNRGCHDAFETYLDCVADADCSYKAACAKPRAALEACTGAFP